VTPSAVAPWMAGQAECVAEVSPLMARRVFSSFIRNDSPTIGTRGAWWTSRSSTALPITGSGETSAQDSKLLLRVTIVLAHS